MEGCLFYSWEFGDLVVYSFDSRSTLLFVALFDLLTGFMVPFFTKSVFVLMIFYLRHCCSSR